MNSTKKCDSKSLSHNNFNSSFLGSQLVKDLFAKKQEKVTTAYIAANPTQSGFNAEIVTDWNRNGQQASDLAYNGYNNYQTLPQNI